MRRYRVDRLPQTIDEASAQLRAIGDVFGIETMTTHLVETHIYPIDKKNKGIILTTSDKYICRPYPSQKGQ